MSELHMHNIEQLTHDYKIVRDALVGKLRDMQARIDAIKRDHMPEIKATLAVVAERHAGLIAAIDSNHQLFNKPRATVFYGVKVGLRKQKGKVEFADEAKVIERMREQLPADQVELLIRKTESVHKSGVYDLTAADLKRLGIRVTDDSDVPVIKVADSDIDKMVDALLGDFENDVTA